MIVRRVITVLIVCCFGMIFTSCNIPKKEQETNAEMAFFEKENYVFTNVGDSLQMTYLDLGDKNDAIVLLLHGEPNYSFVYRNIAPKIVQSGYRVIIPDLVGFGNSSKPNQKELITYSNHTKWLTNFITNLNLDHINLFAHDWGAMISLRIVADQPDRFEKVAISYGYLFEGTEQIPESFENFKEYANNDASFLPGNIMNWGSNKDLSDSIVAKYNQPFIIESDYYSVRKFPSMIPMDPDEKEAIINQKLNQKLAKFDKPFLTIWGNHKDSMWMGKDSILQVNILGAKSQKHATLASNHFIQEDQPEKLTKLLLDFFE